MWVQLLESVVGSAAAVSLAFGLSRHTALIDPTQAPPVPVRGGSVPPPPPTPVTGQAWEQVWAQAEQVGWARLVAAGVLRPVGVPVIDPGNPLGTRLLLVEHVGGAFGDCRVLLAVNATPNSDGAHDLVAVPVPSHFEDPLAAAAWTYDDPEHAVRTTRAAYAALARRT